MAPSSEVGGGALMLQEQRFMSTQHRNLKRSPHYYHSTAMQELSAAVDLRVSVWILTDRQNQNMKCSSNFHQDSEVSSLHSGFWVELKKF